MKRPPASFPGNPAWVTCWWKSHRDVHPTGKCWWWSHRNMHSTGKCWWWSHRDIYHTGKCWEVSHRDIYIYLTTEAVPGSVYRESPSLKHREVLLLFANMISPSDLTSRPDKWTPSCYNPPSFLSRHAATTDSFLSYSHRNHPVKRTANETNWNTAKFTLQARNTYLVPGRVNIHFNPDNLARKMHQGFDYGYRTMNTWSTWLHEECDCERCTKTIAWEMWHYLKNVA